MRVTMDSVADLDMNNPRVSAAPAAFSLRGQQTLVSNCSATGGSFHSFMTQSLVAGPNAFVRCSATGAKVDAESHQRWATGTLYDNVESPAISIQNRNNLGSGHGWSGANFVLWNCRARTYLVQNPPTAHNWAIGCTGSIGKPLVRGFHGIYLSAGRPVLPVSLYDQQLSERSGEFQR